jgi:nondiscriminating glutamyl-tRNA synthetase
LPGGLINYLALVGWSPDDNEEILSLDEMVEKFSFDRVSKTGGIFDKDKLDWVNGHYIRSSSVERITELAIPYLIEANYIDEKFAVENKEWLYLLIDTVKESISTIKEIVEKVEFIFDDEIEVVDEGAKELLKGDQVPALMAAIVEELNNVDEIDMENAKTFMKTIQKATGIKGKNLFMPTRVAITGSEHGPELVNIIYLLGKDKLIKRISKILNN